MSGKQRWIYDPSKAPNCWSREDSPRNSTEELLKELVQAGYLLRITPADRNRIRLTLEDEAGSAEAYWVESGSVEEAAKMAKHRLNGGFKGKREARAFG